MGSVVADLYRNPIDTLTDLIDNRPDALQSLFASVSQPFLEQIVVQIDLVQHATHDALHAHLAGRPIPSPALRPKPSSTCYFDRLIAFIGSVDSLSDAVHRFWSHFLSECEQASVISSTNRDQGHLGLGLALVCSPVVLAHSTPVLHFEVIEPDRFPIAFAAAATLRPVPCLIKRFIFGCYFTHYDDQYVAARVIDMLARVVGPDLDGLGHLIRGVPVRHPNPRLSLRVAALIVVGRLQAFISNQLVEFLLLEPVNIVTRSLIILLENRWTAPLAIEAVADSRFVEADANLTAKLSDLIFDALDPVPVDEDLERLPPCCQSWRRNCDRIWELLRPDLHEVLNGQSNLLRCTPELAERVSQRLCQLVSNGLTPPQAAAAVQILPKLIQTSLIQARFWSIAAMAISVIDNAELADTVSSLTSLLNRIETQPSDDYVDAILNRLLKSTGSLFGHLAEHVYELKERHASVAVRCLVRPGFSADLVALVANASDALLVTNSATLLGVLIYDIVSKRIKVDRPGVRRIARANLIPICCRRLLEAAKDDAVDLVRALLDCICISVHLNEAEITSNLFCKSATGPPLLLRLLQACSTTPYRSDQQLIHSQRLLVVAACRNADSRFAITFSKSPDVMERLLVLFGGLEAPVDESDLQFLEDLIGVEAMVAPIRNLPRFAPWLRSFGEGACEPRRKEAVRYFLQALRLQ